MAWPAIRMAHAFDYATDGGRTGQCLVSIDAVTDFVLKRRTLEADVCGHTVTETTTWS
jgi:hypothetical protein